MDIIKLDWNEYHKYIDKLAVKIEKKMQADTGVKYKYIAGVEPDDMFVAVHLSHKLGIPVVTDINLFSMLANFTNNTEQVLVVSNVVETGKTFKSIMEQTGGHFDTATLFKDKNSKYNPSYYVKVPEEHVYFPWEKCGI